MDNIVDVDTTKITEISTFNAFLDKVRSLISGDGFTLVLSPGEIGLRCTEKIDDPDNRFDPTQF